jgi:hypothetical protein
MKLLSANSVKNSTMNDAQGPQNNENNHFHIYGDVNIFENDTVQIMCLFAIILALIAVILALTLALIVRMTGTV